MVSVHCVKRFIGIVHILNITDNASSAGLFKSCSGVPATGPSLQKKLYKGDGDDAAATMCLSIAGSIFSAFLLPNATPIPWAMRTGMSSRNISVFSAPLQRYPPAAGRAMKTELKREMPTAVVRRESDQRQKRHDQHRTAGPGRPRRPPRVATPSRKNRDRLRSGHGHLSLRPVRFPVLPEKDGDAETSTTI